jgi:two-component system sensor histidine kinase UhpB
LRFERQSSIRAGLLAALVGGIWLAAAGFAVDGRALLGAGLAVTALSAGALTLNLISTERRRHERIQESLASQASFLESLVESMSAIAATTDPEEILEVTRREAERLFGARASLVRPGEQPRRTLRTDVAVIALRDGGQDLGALRLERHERFAREDTTRARVLGDFAVRAYENARLLGEAQVREAERARLSDQLLTAEQDERRRLADHLHDTSVQELAGVGLLLDAAVASLDAGRLEEAAPILRRALERQRMTIRGLRDLSFNLEPVVLRDQGLAPAVQALTEQLGLANEMQIETSVEGADALAEKAQAGLYQFVRDALTQAIMRGPPERASVRIAPTADGAVEAVVVDDGPREKRLRNFEVLAERANTLNGQFEVDQGAEGGTTVRVQLPPYVARS